MKNTIIPFALSPVDVGYRNQIIGALNAICNLTGETLPVEDLFVLPKGVSNYLDVKDTLHYSQFKNYTAFKSCLFECLDEYFKKVKHIPRLFITVYNPTESSNPGKNADKLCAVVKEFYRSRNLGYVMTIVLTSRYYKYKNVDLINIPKHLMTFALRIRLIRNKKLRNKIFITTGTINNFNIHNVKLKFSELTKKLNKLKKDNELKPIISKFENYKKTSKKVVFLLGGRVEGPEIIFDIDYAQKLYNDALKLASSGYGVAFINGPRTPNNVSDFLHEKALTNPNIIFHNCKRIAQKDEERTLASWRIYSGKHEKEF